MVIIKQLIEPTSSMNRYVYIYEDTKLENSNDI